MEPDRSDKHFLEALRDFLTSRTKLELVSLGAIVLLLIDLLVIELRATTLLLIAVATLPWWLPYFRSYLWKEEEAALAEKETEKETEAVPTPPRYDETDEYGA